MCYRQSRRGVSRQDSKKCKTIVCIADTLLHTKAFRHKSFYTQKLLHTVAFTQMLLHTDAFTDKGFYSQKLVHTDAFTYRRFYTDTFTHRHFYTQKLLDTDTLTHRSFYTQRLLHTQTLFTHRRFYTQTLLHTETFTHTHTQTLLYICTFTHGGNRGYWHYRQPAYPCNPSHPRALTPCKPSCTDQQLYAQKESASLFIFDRVSARSA